MKNRTLRDEAKDIVKNKGNVSKVFKDVIGGYPSIEITEKEPKSASSFLYKKEADRDADFAELEAILK